MVELLEFLRHFVAEVRTQQAVTGSVQGQADKLVEKIQLPLLTPLRHPVFHLLGNNGRIAFHILVTQCIYLNLQLGFHLIGGRIKNNTLAEYGHRGLVGSGAAQLLVKGFEEGFLCLGAAHQHRLLTAHVVLRQLTTLLVAAHQEAGEINAELFHVTDPGFFTTDPGWQLQLLYGVFTHAIPLP